ncbi:hypothetical protein Taro_055371 [Colocasia esculenta]|uniref:beta-galactosidase n=1 Tax=Colocasia esculenta TaxID=4460 RepID=A0A843XTF6_COLES|nr:hypothetical protein [Colocasia esculenta]
MNSLIGFSYVLVVIAWLFQLALAAEVSYDKRALKINGERKIVISGSIHYPRSTPEMWPDLIRKAKEGGLDAIETYVFWNAHEPRRKEYHFEDNLDLVRFIKDVQSAGLYAIVRLGPYVCAEWNYGGLPVWLHQTPGMQIRTDNQLFKDEMQTFVTLIINMFKKDKLFAPQGGNIILAQIENEYGDVEHYYGDAGRSYVQWCAKLAGSLEIGVPWVMCKQKDAPSPTLETHNGFYGESYQPSNSTTPKMWTENWTGWFVAWGTPIEHRPVEDLAYSVARFFQSGGTLQNYYMYHGGTNFGRTAGGPYMITSYDYDAPLDEYGNPNQPKWGHLQDLHLAIKAMEKTLLYGKTKTYYLNETLVTTYYGAGMQPGCFLTNANSSHHTTVTFQGKQYVLPPWSTSILPGCKKEAYNTAKVSTQASIMVKCPTTKEDASLSWSWRPERIRENLKRDGVFTKHELIEQKLVTGDASDYLWYMTSVDLSKEGQMKLRVNTAGHGLHAFFNEKHIGSHYAPFDGEHNVNYSFVFEQNVVAKPGRNSIALLSISVGLKNYGPAFDLNPEGIVGGPVELIRANDILDLSSNPWSYKIGIDGEERRFYLHTSDDPHGWQPSGFPTMRPFTWYKTKFSTPLGKDPVVLDTIGMGKGEAWVNGKSIGRFWPKYLATTDGCKPCDYRGGFSPGNCQTGCGQPSQRWYHVPRSFLKAGETNTLVLFEEIGGDPSRVSFQTVTTGVACGNVHEGKTLTLSCQGERSISSIQFASFGDPHGTCKAFRKGSCEAKKALSIVQQACVGKSSCSIDVSEAILGETNCSVFVKRLAVQAACS